MGELPLADLPLPMSVLFGAVAAGVYLVNCFRPGHGAFTILDAVVVVAIMGAVTAAAAPVLNKADENARAVAFQENLRAFKQAIELYKLDHGGKPPLLFKGGFPQMTSATNSEGVPGPRGAQHPYGPYFPAGLPVNPYTGSSLVELVDKGPPPQRTGTGGWFYDQSTGQIAAQLPEGVELPFSSHRAD